MTIKNGILTLTIASALTVVPAFADDKDKDKDRAETQTQTQEQAAMGGAQDQAGNALSQDTVRKLQQALSDEGYDVQVDGIWGPSTEQALTQFQQENNLEGNGQLNPATIEKLDLQAQQTAAAGQAEEPQMQASAEGEQGTAEMQWEEDEQAQMEQEEDDTL